jgi:hypothetical protein
MILLLLLLVICWSHCVLTQPLQDDQYIALMNVYDGLGSFPHSRSFRILRFFFFFFFFFSAGCNTTVCPRFNATTSCIGSHLRCVDGNVTQLCVRGRGSEVFVFFCI